MNIRDPGSKQASAKTLPSKTLPDLIRPYGDTTGDGMVQVSFTLPIPHDKRAEGAALQLAAKMGLAPALLVHAKAMGSDFTFFIVYGACIGTDAHTVGIDAILNIKGFAGEKGLEYYTEIKVVNCGAQVLVPELVARARAEKADAVLVSQVVTQKDAHIHNTMTMSAAFREAYPAGKVPLLIVGGPRFEQGSAAALGVDRIFGKGTTPGEVASYLVHAIGVGEVAPSGP